MPGERRRVRSGRHADRSATNGHGERADEHTRTQSNAITGNSRARTSNRRADIGSHAHSIAHPGPTYSDTGTINTAPGVTYCDSRTGADRDGGSCSSAADGCPCRPDSDPDSATTAANRHASSRGLLRKLHRSAGGRRRTDSYWPTWIWHTSRP